ncbi:uncharacterized protein FTOL_01993 [Fusarium torulosum]|uniref:F-box domain-containing protein n=1 Tax=Fusarium torulosum TaxID=33205 RepID=A0AAE8M181_9HYPO|nr:uncharacterized protein FTOL_01993 [Fusarium torulosum]
MTSDTILDICTYHPDFDLVLIRSLPDETQAVTRGLQTAFKSPTPSSLGLLDRLPIELVWMVFRNLDVQSYFRFRHANRKARAACTAIPEYQAIAKYGLEGLRGMLRAGLAQTVTIGDLYKSLIRETCENCTRLASYKHGNPLHADKEIRQTTIPSVGARVTHGTWFIFYGGQSSPASKELDARKVSYSEITCTRHTGQARIPGVVKTE